MKLSFRAEISDFEVVQRDGVALVLRTTLRSSEASLRTALPDVAGDFEWPASVEVAFRMYEGEIAERLWALRGRAGLDVTIVVNAADGSL
jgi:hypothetical protein